MSLLLSGYRAKPDRSWHVLITSMPRGIVVGRGDAKTLEAAIGQALSEAEDAGADFASHDDTVTLGSALIHTLTTTRFHE